MKAVRILLFVMIVSAKLGAQQYVPFPTDSARWISSYSIWTAGCGGPNQFQYEITGDTMLGNLVYHKLNEVSYSFDPCFNPGSGYAGCIREDSSKHVYYVQPADTVVHLLYDFNLNVGDTLHTYTDCCNDAVVTLIDSVLIGSTYRKQYWISTGFWCGNAQPQIIEGIGSTTGLLECFGFYEAHFSLNCFWHNGQTLYPFPNTGVCGPLIAGVEETATVTWSAFPNPATESTVLTSPALTDNTIYTISIYSLSGQLVRSESAVSRNSEIVVPQNDLEAGYYFIEVAGANGTIGRVKIAFL